MHVAVRHGHASITELLLLHGVDIETRNKDGWTPLHCSMILSNDDISTVKVLLNNKADIQVI